MIGSLDEFLKSYVEKYKFGTISSETWKQYFLQYFHQQVKFCSLLSDLQDFLTDHAYVQWLRRLACIVQ